ncbi:MAG: type II secretion protein F, partial [Deltaproteobacteria bacterium]|nr:type II secretion protein F [Deltaproteobacteria bacterium]
MKAELNDLYLWLTNGLRAGLNLPQAMALAAREIPPPLGT